MLYNYNMIIRVHSPTIEISRRGMKVLSLYSNFPRAVLLRAKISTSLVVWKCVRVRECVHVRKCVTQKKEKKGVHPCRWGCDGTLDYLKRIAVICSLLCSSTSPSRMNFLVMLCAGVRSGQRYIRGEQKMCEGRREGGKGNEGERKEEREGRSERHTYLFLTFFQEWAPWTGCPRDLCCCWAEMSLPV